MLGYLFPKLPPVALEPGSGRVSSPPATSLVGQSFLQQQLAPGSLNRSLPLPLLFLLHSSDFSKQPFSSHSLQRPLLNVPSVSPRTQTKQGPTQSKPSSGALDWLLSRDH